MAIEWAQIQRHRFNRSIVGPILRGHSGPLCHALSLLLWTSILHCHSPGVATVAHRLRYSWLRLILVVVSTVATPGEWQCKIRTGGVRRLAVANGPNIFRMLIDYVGYNDIFSIRLPIFFVQQINFITLIRLRVVQCCNSPGSNTEPNLTPTIAFLKISVFKVRSM